MSNETTTAGTAGTTTARITTTRGPSLPNSRDSIRCEITPKGEIELVPTDALGARFLSQFGHGPIKPAWLSVASFPDTTFQRLVLTCEPWPVLSTGGDPFHAGIALSADEVKECRALVEQLREAKRPARHASKPAKKRGR